MSTAAEEVKNKLDLVEVVGEYVRLNPAGGQSLKGLCPFHAEKTPSFFVHRDKQFWHCFGCFPPGQKIKTPFGYHDIETLNGEHFVVSDSADIRRIQAGHERSYHGELVTIRPRKLTYPVSLTADHRVFAVRGSPCMAEYKNFSRQYKKYLEYLAKGDAERYFRKVEKYLPIRKIPAGQLRRGDMLLYPIDRRVEDLASIDLGDYLAKRPRFGPHPPKIPFKVGVDEKLLRLFGYYVAEGSNHRAYIRFSLGNHEEEFAREIVGLIKGIFRLDASIFRRRPGKGRTGLEVTCCHSQLADIFENLMGKGAANKHFPFAFQRLPSGKQRILIEALNKGDGHDRIANKSKNLSRSITTVSEVLAEQISDMLLRCSFFPSVHVSPAKKDSKGVNHREAYTVFWSEESRPKYDLVYHHDGAEYWLLPILSLKRARYEGPVYNLSVEGDHSYVTRSFAVANCGEGGDVFTFYEKVEHLEFPDALRELARKAGVELPEYQPQEESERSKLLAVLEDAARFFEAALKHQVGERARVYLDRRKMTSETIAEFRLGYAPATWDALVKALSKKGHAPERIVAAGLAITSDRGRGNYDRFRDRIMIPLRDEKGAVVGFTGRILPDSPEADKTGKYVNTPETQVYHKRRLVFALDRAKGQIKAADFAVLVEGNMDAVSSHQAGVKNVVAVSGTAFTEEQIDLLKRYTSRIALSFDADVAGQNAMSKALPHAWKSGMQVLIVLLPPGFKDPDEVICKDPALWREAIGKARDMIEYSVDKALKNVKPEDPFSKKKALESLKTIFGLLDDPVLFDHWVHAVAERLRVSDEAVREAVAVKAKTAVRAAVTAQPAPAIETREEKLAERFFSLILNAPALFQAHAGKLEPPVFPEGGLRDLAKLVKGYYTDSGQPAFERPSFFTWLEGHKTEYGNPPPLEPILLLKDRDFSGWSEEQLAEEAETCVKELGKSFRKRVARDLLNGIEEAEKRGDAKGAAELAKKLEDLMKAA